MPSVSMTVNDKQVSGEVEGRTLLVQFLREHLGLTGTHVGCDTSQCGACTVHVNGRAMKSCSLLALHLDGADVQTIEGLADGDTLHPMQEAFRENHALQCGFCTPGFVVSVAALVAENDDPTLDEVKKALSGNLCRCGTYTRVFAAAQTAARRVREGA